MQRGSGAYPFGGNILTSMNRVGCPVPCTLLSTVDCRCCIPHPHPRSLFHLLPLSRLPLPSSVFYLLTSMFTSSSTFTFTFTFTSSCYHTSTFITILNGPAPPLQFAFLTKTYTLPLPYYTSFLAYSLPLLFTLYTQTTNHLLILSCFHDRFALCSSSSSS
ncbi:hypothetical protein CPB83DRAFT_473124 [Crepidotus variabilis]|uniref:Uncharacterized protein n=1 Tax=Crepidotus variabilis TaxID=179855 RepID=A0A9P6JVG2_9AGAR|nr:hypothetical protein CPB83DRAFT_473124 [Crepidotus variabilis]